MTSLSRIGLRPRPPDPGAPDLERWAPHSPAWRHRETRRFRIRPCCSIALSEQQRSLSPSGLGRVATLDDGRRTHRPRAQFDREIITDDRRLFRLIGLGLPAAVWVLGVVTPPPGGWSAGGLTLFTALLTALAIVDQTAPARTDPVGRRLLWLGVEVVLCFAVVLTHGTLIRPAFAYLVPACRALPLFGERRGLLMGLLIWPAYLLNVGLDVWPDRLHEYPNYLLILLVVWAAAVLPVYASLRQAAARRHAEALYAELRAAHEQLATLHRRAREAAVAEERNRLAREIHDTLAHYLTVVNVQLEAAEKLAGNQPARSLEAVGRARRLTLECLQEVRRSVGALRAATIEELALPRALAKLTREFAESTGLAVQLDASADILQLPPESSQALYRVVQEGLTNVHRHAHATRARVALSASEGLVSLQVEDDGVGPNGQAEAPDGGGFGLVGLRERVALLGGHLDFGPGPDGGSCLRVTLPVEARR
jgi:signal transduction histidine kinase